MQFPQKAEDFDEGKGIEFKKGRWGKTVIEMVRLVESGIVLDTADSTEVSEAILLDALQWIAAKFELRYSPEMIKRRVYLNQVAFYSEAPLLHLNPLMDKIARKVSETTSEDFGRELEYVPTVFSLQFDPTLTPVGPAIFTIQRREKHLFSDNKYFSSAPLRTDKHLELLEIIEHQLTPSV
jgi:hypothetical protein